MAFVVVRCPGCRGAARTASASLGVAVECPRCGAAFQAVEEAALLVPGEGWVPPNPPPPRPWRGPATPHHLDDDSDDDYDDDDDEEYDSELDGDEGKPEFQALAVERPHPKAEDPDDDKPLPASVFIGLALLPFLIPIVWGVASVVAQPPVLTVATPIALAIATSVLCLAVISTIDWTPATRVKGVLLLLTLSYLTGLGLYFLKREMVERVRKFFGVNHAMTQDIPPGAGYKVLVPGRPVPHNGSPMSLVKLECRHAMQPAIQGPYTFVYGSSQLPKGNEKPNAELGTEAWFEKAVTDIAKQAGVAPQRVPQTLRYNDNDDSPGREVVLKLQDGRVKRVVRIYVIKGRVYYLSVERLDLDPEDDDLMREFFESFEHVP